MAKKTTRKKTAAKTRARAKTARKGTASKTKAKKTTARKATAAKRRAGGQAARKASKASRKTTRKAATKSTAKTARKTASKATSKVTPKRTSKGERTSRKTSRPAAPRPAEAAPVTAEKPRSRRKKSPYSKTQLKPMRKVLLERRQRVVADLNLMGDEALQAADPDVDAESVADHGSDAYERNLTLGLMEHDSRTLRKIDSALDAMDAGVYGLCEECNDAIPLPRLEALPFATTCVPCQEREERLG